MTDREIFEPFAIVALSAKNELLKVDERLKHETNSRNRAILKRQQVGLIHILDRCFRLTGDFIPVGVSEKARDYCVNNQLGELDELFKTGWDGQKKFEGKYTRKECQLKHEHKIPVSALVEKTKSVNSIKAAVGIFLSQEIVWVCKDEDRKLPKSNRPDPDQAYKDAGIVVIKNPNPIGHLFDVAASSPDAIEQ